MYDTAPSDPRAEAGIPALPQGGTIVSHCQFGDIGWVRPRGSSDAVTLPASSIPESKATVGEPAPGPVVWANQPRTAYESHEELDAAVSAAEVTIVDSGAENLRAYLIEDNHKATDLSVVSPGGAPSASAVDIKVLRGTGATTWINSFILHPAIDYRHSVPGNPPKIAFVATYNGNHVGFVMLGRPTATEFAHRSRIQLLRMAAHEESPKNLPSRLLSYAADWARLQGYSEIVTYAGITGNSGTAYEASGYDFQGAEHSDTSRATSRSGRQSFGEHYKRTYTRTLSDTHLEARRGFSDSQQQLRTKRTAAPSCSNLIQTREEPGLDGGSYQPIESHPELHHLLDSHAWRGSEAPTDHDIPLGSSRSVGDVQPIAVFGARTESNELISALVLTTESSPSRDSTGAVFASLYADSGSKYPENTCRWLASRARNWADLHGFTRFVAEPPFAGPAAAYPLSDVFETVPLEAGSRANSAYNSAVPPRLATLTGPKLFSES